MHGGLAGSSRLCVGPLQAGWSAALAGALQGPGSLCHTLPSYTCLLAGYGSLLWSPGAESRACGGPVTACVCWSWGETGLTGPAVSCTALQRLDTCC